MYTVKEGVASSYGISWSFLPNLHVFDIRSYRKAKEMVLNNNIRNLDLTIKCFFLGGKYC